MRLGVLAGGIAHDFNNLLMGVLCDADLALHDLPPDGPAVANVAAIKTAAERLAELTRQMLAYSGKRAFVIRPVDLSATVEEMAHLLRVSISKQATISYDLAPRIWIDADAGQLQQLIRNLLINASDAIGDAEETIGVRTGLVDAGAGEQQVFLELSDSGCGMDDAGRERIFEPFCSTKFTGRGLGLAAALGIMRGHGGELRVDSRPGEGSTFTAQFPRCGSAAVAASGETARVTEHATGRVLLVDDEEVVREVASRMLTRRGIRGVDRD